MPNAPLMVSKAVVMSLKKSRRDRLDISTLNRMAGVAIRGGLINAVLSTSAAHHWSESKNLTSGFADKLICSIRQNTCVPHGFAFICNDNRIPEFQIDHWVKLRLTERNVVWIGECFCQRQLRGRAMASLALNVLDIGLVGMNIAVAHGFGAGVTINTIQRVLAFGELGDGLIIILQAIRRKGMVGALEKSHRL
jgi:hypothetical protein